MSDEQVANVDKKCQVVASNELDFVQTFEDTWQNAQGLSAGTLRQMLRSLLDQDGTVTIQTVVKYLVYSMEVHWLQTIAIFTERAEDGGIDMNEREATLKDVEADTCAVLELHQRLSVHTYQDLLKLGRIITSIQGLGKSETAEQAQFWLYNMLAIYAGRLKRAHLILPASEIES